MLDFHKTSLLWPVQQILYELQLLQYYSNKKNVNAKIFATEFSGSQRNVIMINIYILGGWSLTWMFFESFGEKSPYRSHRQRPSFSRMFVFLLRLTGTWMLLWTISSWLMFARSFLSSVMFITLPDVSWEQTWVTFTHKHLTSQMCFSLVSFLSNVSFVVWDEADGKALLYFFTWLAGYEAYWYWLLCWADRTETLRSRAGLL